MYANECVNRFLSVMLTKRGDKTTRIIVKWVVPFILLRNFCYVVSVGYNKFCHGF